MDKDHFRTGTCPVGRGLSIVGDAWSMLVLRDAGFGLTRFDQFRASLGIAPNILTKRLKALTDDGLLEKRLYSERPPREDYVLTAKGRDFLPVLFVIAGWAHTHMGDGPISRVVDAETGVPVEPMVVDRATGAPIGTRPLRLEQPESGTASGQA